MLPNNNKQLLKKKQLLNKAHRGTWLLFQITTTLMG